VEYKDEDSDEVSEGPPMEHLADEDEI